MENAELIKALKEDAEWAHANEWETPITLGDHLDAAADALEMADAKMHEQDLRIAAPVRAGAGNRILLDKGNALSCFPEHQRCMPCCVA